MKTISVHAFKKALKEEGEDGSVEFINVCTPAEYDEKHIEGVRNIPLDQLPKNIEELRSKKKIYLHCRSGKRGAKGIETLKQSGIDAECINVEGGILAWAEENLPTKSKSNRMPIMRQALLAAGALILISMIAGWIWNPAAYLLATFVGGGLTVAGLTGWCGMTHLLAKMPWNK